MAAQTKTRLTSNKFSAVARPAPVNPANMLTMSEVESAATNSVSSTSRAIETARAV